MDQAAVLARKADRLAAKMVDQRDDVLLHFAAEHPFDDFIVSSSVTRMP